LELQSISNPAVVSSARQLTATIDMAVEIQNYDSTPFEPFMCSILWQY
jgi:hypothetical protein